MQTIFDTTQTKNAKITLEELENQSCNVLPNREELVVIDAGFTNPSFAAAVNTPDTFTSNHAFTPAPVHHPAPTFVPHHIPPVVHPPASFDPVNFDCDFDKRGHDDFDNHGNHGNDNRHIDTRWNAHHFDNRWVDNRFNTWHNPTWNTPAPTWHDPTPTWNTPTWNAPVTTPTWNTWGNPTWDTRAFAPGGPTFLANNNF